VENIYIAYNFSHFAIYLPKLIKMRGNLTNFLTETKMHSFFGDQGGGDYCKFADCRKMIIRRLS